jgi:pimeloyl-ACP methyl ester carboxylesterase
VTDAGAIEPDVVLLHGVGLAPSTFDPLVTMVARSSAPCRSRYRPGAVASDVSVFAEAEDLLREHAGARPVVMVGVSGGATLAVAMAIVGHPGLVGVIAHEPLIGPSAPELHAAVSVAAAELLTGTAPVSERATAFVRGLVGADTWDTLPAAARTFPAEHASVVIDEVPRFVEFSVPSPLVGFAAPVTVTTGERSPERRHHVARLLAAAGAGSRTIRGAGHLAAWEQPRAFADLVHDEVARWRAAA